MYGSLMNALHGKEAVIPVYCTRVFMCLSSIQEMTHAYSKQLYGSYNLYLVTHFAAVYMLSLLLDFLYYFEFQLLVILAFYKFHL